MIWKQFLPKTATFVLKTLVVLYRLLLAPFMGGQCRFSPSCSAYALEALDVHPPARAAWLSLKRLAKCHPWHAGGHDPVKGLLS